MRERKTIMIKGRSILYIVFIFHSFSCYYSEKPKAHGFKEDYSDVKETKELDKTFVSSDEFIKKILNTVNINFYEKSIGCFNTSGSIISLKIDSNKIIYKNEINDTSFRLDLSNVKKRIIDIVNYQEKIISNGNYPILETDSVRINDSTLQYTGIYICGLSTLTTELIIGIDNVYYDLSKIMNCDTKEVNKFKELLDYLIPN